MPTREVDALQTERLVNNVYFLPGASNIGLVVCPGERALLIDTGVGQRSGRQLLRLLQTRGLHLTAILNTHCHGDHVGGNAYLVEHTGARVYAPMHDAVVMEQPIWGTMCMFGGAEPIAEMAEPRFHPQPCAVDVRVSEGEITLAGVTVQVVSLPGHTGSHTGYVVGDVFFTGDILAGEVELVNTALSYAYSLSSRLRSLEKLRSYTCSYYVLGHGAVERNITELVERNIAQVLGVAGFIKSHLAQGDAEVSDLLAATCANYGIEIRNLRQYFLYYPTLYSFLSYLHDLGEIKYRIRDNRLLWYTAERSDAC
jgi:glyoxylase-like metal-dependent hydrolase (beta-lactamase superfamily II)